MITINKPNNHTTVCVIPKNDVERLDFIQCKEPYQTIEAFKNSQTIKPDIVINGGFFNLSSGKTEMDYIDNGIKKSNDTSWNSYGIGIKLDGELCCGFESDKWKDFLTAYPPLLIDGKFNTMNIAKNLNYRTRRSIIGYNQNNIYLITIDNPGAILREAAEVAEQAGCLYAINLDGGGSTRMITNDATYAAAAYNRPVDNVIAFWLKKHKKTIYRVQLGAFARKESAMAYCEEIKKVSANAFVKYVEPYYKVCAGAFSIKSNAEKLVLQLKSYGYNSFIVKEEI